MEKIFHKTEDTDRKHCRGRSCGFDHFGNGCFKTDHGDTYHMRFSYAGFAGKRFTGRGVNPLRTVAGWTDVYSK